ncbi:hypothetical protein ACGFIF_43110 [Kribbella sp. NPDC049174]|uniref:ParB family protein n=1 Tax=Kribbella sp. NPDC049174 TaxID=3364112 RepID=UPI0037233BE4
MPEPETPPADEPTPKKGLVRIQGYATAEENTRIRNAYAAVSSPSNYPNIGHFVTAAVLEFVERLEREHNDGKPFPTPAGGVKSRRGRPAAIPTNSA